MICNPIFKYTAMFLVAFSICILSSCKKEDKTELSDSNNLYIGYTSSTRDLDGEFHIDSDGDGDLDGFATCVNSAMAVEIEDHINQYTWLQEPYVKIKLKLTDAPNFKYQITQILEKGIGGY